MEEAKITSVEKVKDPKRVEAGKRLAAMSKQAKDKKALSQKMSDDEFQIPSIDSINPLALVGVVGVVGVVVYYKYFSEASKTKSEADRSRPKGGKWEAQAIETKETKTLDSQKENPKRRELDTLD